MWMWFDLGPKDCSFGPRLRQLFQFGKFTRGENYWWSEGWLTQRIPTFDGWWCFGRSCWRLLTPWSMLFLSRFCTRPIQPMLNRNCWSFWAQSVVCGILLTFWSGFALWRSLCGLWGTLPVKTYNHHLQQMSKSRHMNPARYPLAGFRYSRFTSFNSSFLIAFCLDLMI